MFQRRCTSKGRGSPLPMFCGAHGTDHQAHPSCVSLWKGELAWMFWRARFVLCLWLNRKRTSHNNSSCISVSHKGSDMSSFLSSLILTACSLKISGTDAQSSSGVTGSWTVSATAVSIPVIQIHEGLFMLFLHFLSFFHLRVMRYIVWWSNLHS